jgi:cyclic pyranopterin phosphate synthase
MCAARRSRLLSHVDAAGLARMVDVGAKPVTRRRAVAEGCVRVSAALAAQIEANSLRKGNLLEVARLAGVQAAKRTGELIPLCHPLVIDFVNVEARLDGRVVRLRAEVACEGKTGVEMEALTAAAVAALTVIDMGKAVDPDMVIEDIRLLEKTGGRSDYRRPTDGSTGSPVRRGLSSGPGPRRAARGKTAARTPRPPRP